MEASICFVQAEVQTDIALRGTSQLSAFFFKLMYSGISVFP